VQCFTHVDPFEDTESTEILQSDVYAAKSFTHVDPFEDTERASSTILYAYIPIVSPTSIRSRILKADRPQAAS